MVSILSVTNHTLQTEAHWGRRSRAMTNRQAGRHRETETDRQTWKIRKRYIHKIRNRKRNTHRGRKRQNDNQTWRDRKGQTHTLKK